MTAPVVNSSLSSLTNGGPFCVLLTAKYDDRSLPTMNPSPVFRNSLIDPNAQSGTRALFQMNVPVFGALATACQDIPASGENQISTLSPVDDPQAIGTLPLSVAYVFRLVSDIAPGCFLYLSNTQGGRKG